MKTPEGTRGCLEACILCLFHEISEFLPAAFYAQPAEMKLLLYGPFVCVHRESAIFFFFKCTA